MKQLLVEIVIPQLAEKGGLDRILNDFAEYVSQKEDFELRFVQLVDTGLVWWNDACPIVNLCKASENPSFMDTAVAYANYLESLEETPDVILATGWPVTITIVREALKRTGLRIPLVGYPHMTLQEGEETGVGGPSCLNEADVIFAISKQVEDEITNSGISVPTLRVNNGIAFPDESLPQDNTLKEKRLLYIGRMVDGKNLEMVFRAMSCTKNIWTLRIVGQGELEKTKKCADTYGVLNRVEFAGFLQNPYADAQEVDFVIMPSNYEGFCLVIPEALARGIPVISTPVGCATEVIHPGENGYLVNINDSAMLAQVLDYIADGRLPIPDAAACRESVMNFELKHCLEVLYQAIVCVYEEIQ